MSEPEPAPSPEDFLRALLNISPEDAEEVRERTPGDRKRPGSGQDAPSTDDGDAGR